MKSALDYCTRLAGFPIPEFMYQSFDLSHRSSDFNHILALSVPGGWIFPHCCMILMPANGTCTWDGSS